MRRAFEGYVRVSSVTPAIKVADCSHNASMIIEAMKNAANDGVALLCLPELCVTGYTCGDLFLQDALLGPAMSALSEICAESAKYPLVTVVGLPVTLGAKLYNVAAVISGGRALGFVPKSFIPNYGEFYELRHFSPAPRDTRSVSFDGYLVPFGAKLLFQCADEPDFCLAAEICEDMWAPSPPSVSHAMAGATVIANPSASDETIGKAEYRRLLASSHSGRLLCCYVYANAGTGESTTDMVFAGHNMIYENGTLLSESEPFGDGSASADTDLRALARERRRINTWRHEPAGYTVVEFPLSPPGVTSLRRYVDPHPFIPGDERGRRERCAAILDIQTAGLAKRLAHTGAQTAVNGVSGGLDSCLALLVTERAMRQAGRPPSAIVAVTMPCFGTTSRTKSNALKLCEALGIECLEIDVSDSVRAHLREIGVEDERRDAVYENAQSRVRTLALMDLANKTGGIVIGTGDLSELALGWSTYNGDHMSMYCVNSGVPKTLARHIVQCVADTATNPLRSVLYDILDTPVSPELLPPSGDDITQKTESIIGPYELHDFFLYHAVRWGRRPSLVLALAEAAFTGVYDRRGILRWLKVFYRRFFASQFKRSCVPDGPKIGSVSLSPRGDWRMPSDAAATAWLAELGNIEDE